jgi:Ca2+-transporting ATPase
MTSTIGARRIVDMLSGEQLLESAKITPHDHEALVPDGTGRGPGGVAQLRHGPFFDEVKRRWILRPNLLRKEDGKGPWLILLRQFTDVMILILLAAAAIAWFMGDLTDTAMILVIVVLNGSLGFSQEYRAERALEALRGLEQPLVVVRRDGRLVQIPSQEIVPGDLMALDEGERIPADGRLIEAAHLRVDESQLTGESVAVTKHTRALHREGLPIGDRNNVVFMGTTVMAGHGWAVATETG